jgi:hypothetical protein
MPPLLYDIARVLLLLTGPAAFVCLLNAGIALRREGGTVFWVGGAFSKWMLWAVIFLGLEPTLTWFQFFGVPVFFPPGFAIGTPWLAGFQQDVSNFVLLAISSTHALLDAWTPTGNRFSVALGLESMWTYLASRIMPIAAGLAICGAIVQFAFNRPGYLRLVMCAAGFLTVSALWILINRMM